MKHLDIKIFGRVQGVFFRISARKKAEKLGISGYVKNMEDKTVKIEAEGEEENLKNFLDWCRKGPLMAKVSRLDHEESEDIKGYKGFEIEYKTTD
ncbi:MAG: acylphosphatase [Candidatus Moranbacteria bacterium]|jgi:acylphosphatase|nr:acylphosphatase [Candidatus Moranbacteria bacterium]MDD5652350.1 acylphosphatase [Candidatus Moranbacteria bacterium]MDX9855649.1 acylphosphatase [Candidatus Moranbacteria bacterium]